jgi:hypothetical protein
MKLLSTLTADLRRGKKKKPSHAVNILAKLNAPQITQCILLHSLPAQQTGYGLMDILISIMLVCVSYPIKTQL